MFGQEGAKHNNKWGIPKRKKKILGERTKIPGWKLKGKLLEASRIWA